MRKTLFSLPAVLAIALSASGQAVITTVGTDADTFSAWRSTDTPKAFNTGTTEAYGTAGYILNYTWTEDYTGTFRQNTGNPLAFTETLTSFSSFFSVANDSMNWAGLSSSYPNVDDPTESIAGTVSDVKVGLAGNNTTRSLEFFNITMEEDLPGTAAGFRIGIVARGAGNDALSTIRLSQTVGGSATAEYTSAVSGTDGNTIYFFDIVGAQQDDVFQFFGSKPNVGNNNVLFTGATFDLIPVPEPGAYALLSGLCALAWIAVRRRAGA